MKRKDICLLCIISIGDNIKKLRFKAGEMYKVAINHPHLISLVDEFGYKMNFSRREDDANLPYLWDYFYEDNKEILDLKIEKLI